MIKKVNSRASVNSITDCSKRTEQHLSSTVVVRRYLISPFLFVCVSPLLTPCSQVSAVSTSQQTLRSHTHSGDIHSIINLSSSEPPTTRLLLQLLNWRQQPKHQHRQQQQHPSSLQYFKYLILSINFSLHQLCATDSVSVSVLWCLPWCRPCAAPVSSSPSPVYHVSILKNLCTHLVAAVAVAVMTVCVLSPGFNCIPLTMTGYLAKIARQQGH